MSVKVVFMGSPDFALPAMEALAEHYPVVGVVTQPDRPAGRGRKLTSPPVKNLADRLGIPAIQPRRIAEAEPMAILESWHPDLIVVAAFGQILRTEVLELPRYGCINVHASLLPRWRGAAPIQAAILHGDPQTGVTIMKMDQGVDTGPILSQQALAISPEETAGSLAPKLARLGALLLIESLPLYLAGELQPVLQQGGATYAPLLKKSDGELDFNLSAVALERKIRAYHPWPGTFINWNEQRLKIISAHTSGDEGHDSQAEGIPGQHLVYEGLPAVVTGEGILIIDELQPAGKKPMPGTIFLRGAREWV
ncbi:MAG: methionyl-tRNA formyltransferase [Anaerolineales bacterium]